MSNDLVKSSVLARGPPPNVEVGPKTFDWKEGLFGKVLRISAKFDMPFEKSNRILVAMPVTGREYNLLRDPLLHDLLGRMPGMDDRAEDQDRQDEHALIILRGWHHGFAIQHDDFSDKEWRIYKMVQTLLTDPFAARRKIYRVKPDELADIFAQYRPSPFRETEQFRKDKHSLEILDCNVFTHTHTLTGTNTHT